MNRRRYIDEMAVDVPEGTYGSVIVERFEVKRDSFQNLTLMHRSCLLGTYTRLVRNGRLWMSDTTAERRDHLEPAFQIGRRGGRVLIGGLGLGMILRVALLTPEVEHVDVIEVDEDVIGAVAPHYEKMAADVGTELNVIHADVFDLKWRPGTRWDVAWFDVWGDVSTDDAPSMTRLRRSYGRRADWCGCWGQELLR